MAISNEFAQALATGRAIFNSSVLEARQHYLNFNIEAFVGFLNNQVDPIIKAVNAISPESVYQVTSDAFGLTIELISKNLAGQSARSSAINKAWMSCAPFYTHLILKDPYRFLGSLSNAILKVESIEGARVDQWIKEMNEISSLLADFDDFFVAGNIVAWRSGHAHLRKLALAAANRFSNDLALKIMGANSSNNRDSIYQEHLNNPWALSHINQGQNFQVAGKFIGFGGNFYIPPEIRAGEDTFIVKSGSLYFQLFADSFGAVVLPCDEELYDHATPNTKTNLMQGSVIFQNAIKVFPKEFINISKCKNSVALFSPYSYSIFVSENDGSIK